MKTSKGCGGSKRRFTWDTTEGRAASSGVAPRLPQVRPIADGEQGQAEERVRLYSKLVVEDLFQGSTAVGLTIVNLALGWLVLLLPSTGFASEGHPKTDFVRQTEGDQAF